MKRHSSVACFTFAAGLALSSSAARVPYANDFATRTSGVSPSDRWMEMPYTTGLVARPYSSYSYHMPYYQSNKIQDGWAMPAANAANNFSYAVIDDGGNQALEAKATASGTNVTAAIVQPLYNEFTNGIVKFSFDLRTPTQGSSMPNSTDDRICIAPLWKSGLNLETGRYSDSPLLFGLSGDKDSKTSVRSFRARIDCCNDGGTGGKSYKMYDTLTYGNWYRYEVEVNLDANTSECSYTDLGTAHPTAASTGKKVICRKWDHSSAPTAFPNRLRSSASAGGIAGVGLYVNLVKDGPADKLPLFDNLSVAWKATAADEYASVYENDFTTRRYRSLVGTTAGAYATSAQSYALTSSSYGHGTYKNVYGVNEDSCQRLVPDAVGPSGALEPLGVDGWRRFDGRDMKFSLIDPNREADGYGWKNGTVLRPTVSKNNSAKTTAHAHLVHPLGSTLTSGKVRLSFDMFAAGKWYAASNADNAWAGVFLGSAIDAPYQTSQNTAKVIMTNMWTCGAGMFGRVSQGGNSTTTYWMASGSSEPTSVFKDVDKSAGVIELPYRTRWYRVILTADLDAMTYDVVAYWAGQTGPAMSDTSFMTDENLVFTKAGRNFNATGPAKIDSIILSVWSAAQYNASTKPDDTTNQVGCYPLFDSIRVCRVNDDGSDGADIYINDFENCTRNVTVDSAAIGAGTDRAGADGWTARGVMQSAAYVTGENPAVVLNGSDDYSKRLLQPLGAVSKGAAEMTVCADIRPPMMAAASNSFVWVELGGDDYWQGNLSAAHAFTDAPRIGFGFAQHKAQAKKSYGYTNLTFAARSASGVATVADDAFVNLKKSSHNWYRFRAKISPSANAFTVSVYDQGAAQPTAASADGTLVATFADQPLPAFAGKGITTVGLAQFGIVGSIGTEEDPNVALVDNLSVDSVPYGMTILIR